MINYTSWTGVSSGSSREDFTLALLTKFQKKLSSAKEKANEKSDEGEQSPPILEDKTENDDDEDWWAMFYLERRTLSGRLKWNTLVPMGTGVHAIAIWASGFSLLRTPWDAAVPATLPGP